MACIALKDENGSPVGTYGSCSLADHWGSITLSSAEQALLDFADAIDLSDTESVGVQSVELFPNPVRLGGAFQVYLISAEPNKQVKLKFAVVDTNNEIIQQSSVKMTTGSPIALLVDESLYNTGQFYRMYYTLSGLNAPNFYQGYGNFLVCPSGGVIGDIEADCL